jgi:hypothetical protein
MNYFERWRLLGGAGRLEVLLNGDIEHGDNLRRLHGIDRDVISTHDSGDLPDDDRIRLGAKIG